MSVSANRTALAIVLITAMLPGCRKNKEVPLLSEIDISNPASASQLIAGFWDLEDGRYRWTKRRFAVVLRPPDGSQQNGATIYLSFFLPQNVIDRLGPVTVSADAGDTSLGAETYDKGGPHEYVHHVPAEALKRELAAIVFETDKDLKTPPEPRELGVVVTRVGLRSVQQQ